MSWQKTINFGLLAATVGFFTLFVGNWEENTRLRERLDHAEQRLEHMAAEHELAINAASEAMKAREEIHAYQKQRLCEVERALGNNPDFCGTLLPDDLRLRLETGPGERDCDVPAAGGIDGAN